MEADKRVRMRVGILLDIMHEMDRLDISDAKLERDYKLSRMTLKKIRSGIDIPRAHGRYFMKLMGVLNRCLSKHHRNIINGYNLDAEKLSKQKLIEKMFDLYQREFEVVQKIIV